MISDHNNKRFGILRMMLSIPFIYAVFIPLVFLDLVITLYQWVCFPLYGIPKVKREHHVQFRRVKMESLNWLDKMNCHYCSYANGVVAYARAIAKETERMWCPIRHKAKGTFVEPEHHKNFVIRAKKADLKAYYEEYEEQIGSDRPAGGEIPYGLHTPKG